MLAMIQYALNATVSDKWETELCINSVQVNKMGEAAFSAQPHRSKTPPTDSLLMMKTKDSCH